MIETLPAPELRPQFQIIRLHNMLPRIEGTELVRNDLDEAGSDILAVRGKDGAEFVNYGFQVWSYLEGETEKANVALLAINDHTEPVYLHDDAVPLSMTCVEGRAKLIVWDTKLRSAYSRTLVKGRAPVQVQPGSAYALAALDGRQAVIYDFCDPPFADGMESPIEINPGIAKLPGTDRIVPYNFWVAYLRGTQRSLDSAAVAL